MMEKYIYIILIFYDTVYFHDESLPELISHMPLIKRFKIRPH